MKGYLRMKGFDFMRACLMLTTFEGSKAEVARQHRRVSAIYRRFGGVDLGPVLGNRSSRPSTIFLTSVIFCWIAASLPM